MCRANGAAALWSKERKNNCCFTLTRSLDFALLLRRVCLHGLQSVEVSACSLQCMKANVDQGDLNERSQLCSGLKW